MRALGPGSVSSFLKIILDVVYVALWISLGAVALALLAALLFSFNPDLFPAVMTVEAAQVARRGPVFAGMLLAFALSIGGVLVIVDALRRIFVTLTAGDPFHPNNVRRLRLVGDHVHRRGGAAPAFHRQGHPVAEPSHRRGDPGIRCGGAGLAAAAALASHREGAAPVGTVSAVFTVFARFPFSPRHRCERPLAISRNCRKSIFRNSG